MARQAAPAGRIVTIDIAKQHDLAHSRITYLIGDSTSAPIVDQVRTMTSSCGGPVFVILDSDHSEQHVARELDVYAWPAVRNSQSTGRSAIGF